MTDSLLTPDDIDHIRAVPSEHGKAAALLGAVCGPLDPDTACSAVVIELAYLIRLASRYGWARGILRGRPSWEAAELLGSRVRAARSRSGSLEDFGRHLMRGVGVRMEGLQATDLVWWRGFLATHGGPDMWRGVRAHLDEALQAAALLDDLMRDYHQALKAATTTTEG